MPISCWSRCLFALSYVPSPTSTFQSHFSMILNLYAIHGRRTQHHMHMHNHHPRLHQRQSRNPSPMSHQLPFPSKNSRLLTITTPSAGVALRAGSSGVFMGHVTLFLWGWFMDRFFCLLAFLCCFESSFC
jgi:hypothetical protein